MKVFPFKIPKSPEENLILQIDKEAMFYNKLHQHKEIQISYIAKGHGTLFIADSIHPYTAGDLIAIGSHVPHVFQSDTGLEKDSQMITLFFTTQSFGNDFFKLVEFHKTKPFFSRVAHGIKISTLTSQIKQSFLKLHQLSRLQRFIFLLQLLDYLSTTKITNLSSFVYPKEITDADGKRMQVIFEYALDHYNQNISLASVANKVFMTPPAFCRYFKQRTNKTFFQFIIELRIEYACKQLIHKKDLSISDIAVMAGFNNLSNFNRKFKNLKKITPKEYRSTIFQNKLI